LMRGRRRRMWRTSRRCSLTGPVRMACCRRCGTKGASVSDRDDIRRLAQILDRFMVGMLNSLTGVISTQPGSLHVQALERRPPVSDERITGAAAHSLANKLLMEPYEFDDWNAAHERIADWHIDPKGHRVCGCEVHQ